MFDLVLLDVWIFSMFVCVCVVCLRLLYLVCSMKSLVFLQVLEALCLLSEQENLEPEEVEVNQPTCSTNMFITSKTKINSTSLSSDSIHKDESCTASLTETEGVSAPLTDVAFPSFLDAESGPPPLSHCTSASQLCLVSFPPLSNCPSDPHLRTLSVADDSCIPPQIQSDLPNSHPCVDLIVTSSEMISNDSYYTQTEGSPIKIVTSHSSLQKDEVFSLPVSNSVSDSLV